MKTATRIPVFIFLTLFLAATAFAEAPVAKKKKLGIATYSVKGLESDIEGAFKSLQQDGYMVMEIANYNAREGKVAGYAPGDYAALGPSIPRAWRMLWSAIAAPAIHGRHRYTAGAPQIR